MRWFLFLACAVSLAGCMVGPDYRRPDVDTPDSFRYEEAEARDTADTEWWKGFGDETLDGLINEALANNKDLRIAVANIDRAAGFLTETRSQLFPQVGYEGTASRQRASESTAKSKPPFLPPDPDDPADPPKIVMTPKPPNPTNTFRIAGVATWEIDLWGRIRRLSEAARAELFASEEARRGVVLSLVAAVAGNYLQLRGLDEELVIARRNLAAYAESVKLFELQFQYGQIARLTVEQAITQYETVAVTIPRIENEIALVENGLSILLGRNPGPIARGRSMAELAVPAIPAGVPSRLLERRPDIRQAEQNLIAANAQIGAAKALYFPTISLTGSLGTQSSEFSKLFSGPARIWSYAGNITGPIFTAGAISGQVRQAEAVENAVLLGYEAAIQNSFAEVEDALITRRKLVEQLQAQERLVGAGRELERLAKLQYDEGYTPYLTVLSAQQQLFPAELDLTRLRADLFVAYVNLYKTMGGGWTDGGYAGNATDGTVWNARRLRSEENFVKGDTP